MELVEERYKEGTLKVIPALSSGLITIEGIRERTKFSLNKVLCAIGMLIDKSYIQERNIDGRRYFYR